MIEFVPYQSFYNVYQHALKNGVYEYKSEYYKIIAGTQVIYPSKFKARPFINLITYDPSSHAKWKLSVT